MRVLAAAGAVLVGFPLLVLAQDLPGGDPRWIQRGKAVYETWCMGCHHPTVEAFGPSFATIASRRTLEQIEAFIRNPDALAAAYGYRRNAMPRLNLPEEDRKAVAAYVLRFGSPSAGP